MMELKGSKGSLVESKGSAKKRFTFFWKAGSPFSQWHSSPFKDDDGQSYQNAEQYMMAEKARLFGDAKAEKQILKNSNPKACKAVGRTVRHYKESTWRKNRTKVVSRGNYLKFTQNATLQEKLMQTGNTTFVEASPNDKIWGIGMREDHPDAKNPKKWKGLNLLGTILTQVRERIKRERRAAKST